MARKLYIENGESIPSVIIQNAVDPAPSGFTEATTIANFFLYGTEYGLTESETLDEIVALITDWSTHDPAEKAQVIAYIEQNHFVASITTEIRNDVTPPYNGFKIFNITTIETEWWNGSTWTTTGGVQRTDFQLIKSGAELDAAFPNVSGVITLTKNVEYQGTIITPHKIDLNGFYLVGRNAFMDKHVYTGTSDAFIGANGGTIKLLTLNAGQTGSKLFNIDDTVGDKIFVLRDSIIANCENIGLIKGFNIVALSIINPVGNVDGVNYEDITNLFIRDVLWNSTNSGTLETYTGDFGIIQNNGGKYDVSSGVTGVDLSGITSLVGGELLSSPFVGDGTFLTGTPNNEWLIDCEGLPLYGDKFASTFLRFKDGTTNTALTQNVWNYFAMATATLDPATNHRFGQLVSFPDTIAYLGINQVRKEIVATVGVRRIGSGTNTYQMRLVKNGVEIDGSVKQFEMGGVDASVTLVALVDLVTDDQIWIEVRNISDNDDIRLLTASLIVK